MNIERSGYLWHRIEVRRALIRTIVRRAISGYQNFASHIE